MLLALLVAETLVVPPPGGSLPAADKARLQGAIVKAASGVLPQAKVAGEGAGDHTLQSQVAKFGESLKLSLKLLDPAGGQLASAVASSSTGVDGLEAALPAACRTALAPLAPAPAPVAAVTFAPGTPEVSGGTSWPWLGAGVAALGAGLILDIAPASAHDHKLTGADFVPLALYAVGATMVIWGASR